MMTREVAIRQLQSLRDHCRSMVRDEYEDGIWVQDIEALDLALSALRPVSREQVEKAEWIWSTGDVYTCSSCGEKTHVDECMENPIYNFCPFCMAPMTDEAVDMMLERWKEAFENA